MSLPLYNPEKGCEKCGCPATLEIEAGEETREVVCITTEYCARPMFGNVCFVSPLVTDRREPIRGEHFHRRCKRCGYIWFEACLPPSGSVVITIEKGPVCEYQI